MGDEPSGRRPEEDDPADDEYTLPTRGDPRGVWLAKTRDRGGHHRTITGALGFDDIEGGCSFIETRGGARYEIVYPDGWALDRYSAELHGPCGEVARAGEELTVRGSVATDRSSICQLGPIFVATEVEISNG